MSKIIIALDFHSVAKAKSFIGKLDPNRCAVKVGKELFIRGGPALVKGLVRRGFQVFLDLKLHDISNTVAGACDAIASLGVWMTSIHAGGGKKMMIAG